VGAVRGCPRTPQCPRNRSARETAVPAKPQRPRNRSARETAVPATPQCQRNRSARDTAVPKKAAAQCQRNRSAQKSRGAALAVPHMAQGSNGPRPLVTNTRGPCQCSTAFAPSWSPRSRAGCSGHGGGWDGLYRPGIRVRFRARFCCAGLVVFSAPELLDRFVSRMSAVQVSTIAVSTTPPLCPFTGVEAMQAPRGVGTCRGGGASPWTPLRVPAPLGVTPRAPSQCRRIVSLSRDGARGEAGGGGDGWGQPWCRKAPSLTPSDLWPLRRCIGPGGVRVSTYAGLTL
jgi:hypothetical protein